MSTTTSVDLPADTWVTAFTSSAANTLTGYQNNTQGAAILIQVGGSLPSNSDLSPLGRYAVAVNAKLGLTLDNGDAVHIRTALAGVAGNVTQQA
jgi:hypothetical protein